MLFYYALLEILLLFLGAAGGSSFLADGNQNYLALFWKSGINFNRYSK